MFRYDADRDPDPEEWLEEGEDERTLAVAEYHRRTKQALAEAAPARVHAAMHTVIENQLAQGDPPQARQALQRLRTAGLSRHDAIHAIASVMTAMMYRLMKGELPKYDPVAYAADLDALTAENWRTRR